jgi:hypothetical protein
MLILLSPFYDDFDDLEVFCFLYGFYTDYDDRFGSSCSFWVIVCPLTYFLKNCGSSFIFGPSINDADISIKSSISLLFLGFFLSLVNS